MMEMLTSAAGRDDPGGHFASTRRGTMWGRGERAGFGVSPSLTLSSTAL